MGAELLMLVGSITGFVLTIYWVRGRELRERYAIGWIVVAALLLICGLFPHTIMGLADASRLSYPSAVLFISLAAIYIFALLVCVALSHHHRRNVRLTQELAMMENRLRMLERDFAAVRQNSLEANQSVQESRAEYLAAS
jgi:hypothetical protein